MSPRAALFALLASAFILMPLTAMPARAAIVPEDLFAYQNDFHRNNQNTPPDPTLTVTAGDSLNLTIYNIDAVTHTFTVPHFSVDDLLPVGLIPTYRNITTSGADVGTWQFWCMFHSTGTGPENRTGMIGWIEVLPAGVPDATPPVITHTPPPGPFSVGTPIAIAANVTDNVAVTTVMLNYTDVAGVGHNVTMTLSAGDYRVTIPAPSAAGNITYFVYAEDSSGNWAVTTSHVLTVAAQSPAGGNAALWIVGFLFILAFLGILVYVWRRGGREKK
jgi:hypothetical protein